MIKIDIDMPESCADCPICHPKGKCNPWEFACFATMEDVDVRDFDTKRFPSCPIVEVDNFGADFSILERKTMDKIIEKEWDGKGTYNIGFTSDNHEDETQFYAESVDEMIELLLDFFRENPYDNAEIVYLEKISGKNV